MTLSEAEGGASNWTSKIATPDHTQTGEPGSKENEEACGEETGQACGAMTEEAGGKMKERAKVKVTTVGSNQKSPPRLRGVPL